MEAAEVAERIREAAKAGRLLARREIEAETAVGDPPVSNPAAVSALIRETISLHEDIEEIQDDPSSAWYFSRKFMTAAYARLLLLKGRGPLEMIAEVIREHSRIYPRPVPLTLFRCPPFDLSDEETALHLKEMPEKPPYRDIACLTTSLGNVYAYSTHHLDPHHATLLAEWTDIGQAENP